MAGVEVVADWSMLGLTHLFAILYNAAYYLRGTALLV